MTVFDDRAAYEEAIDWMTDERFLGPDPEAEKPLEDIEPCSCESGTERMVNEGAPDNPASA
ncbi:hypothetical protein [Indiicoccus explosivorum]|uniref:hypothetical protein n=1 Tax=Indiicoccus explosivorum TaxID=1917864 RepID=UPI000B448846|nr:hypothetical protein [Indiicoccus explosivorum]